MTQAIDKIYLHWTGTDYDWCRSGVYHTLIGAEGQIYHLTDYHQPLPAHTYCRNHNSVALAVVCMADEDWVKYPPTPVQLETLCQEVAQLAHRLDWTIADISLERILTHAEAAANRDFPLEKAHLVSGWPRPLTDEAEADTLRRCQGLGLIHENYGPEVWWDGWPGGHSERGDLFRLKPTDPPGQGGFDLRARIRDCLQETLNVQPSRLGYEESRISL